MTDVELFTGNSGKEEPLELFVNPFYYLFDQAEMFYSRGSEISRVNDSLFHAYYTLTFKAVFGFGWDIPYVTARKCSTSLGLF